MDVGGWLRKLGLEQYEAAFCENKIDDTCLFLRVERTCCTGGPRSVDDPATDLALVVARSRMSSISLWLLASMVLALVG